MKEKLTGLYMNDAQKLNDLDTVSGATYSSNAIKNATMNALGVKIEQEVIPDAPTEKPAPGLYYIEMKDRTDVVDHGLVGESKKVGAYLRVDNDGKMWLTYKMVSGTTGEPLYVLGYNGYYPNGDTTQPLTKEGVTYSTESTTAPTIGDCTVVTDITVPLDGISQTYVNNVYLYVEAMKNLNGEVSGVYFDAGKFNINSTITLYWDTLYNLSEDSGAAELAKLSDGVYKLTGEMVKVNKVDMSMSNNAINHNIKLVVKNGVPYVNMNFNSLTITSLKGYLKNLSYYASGYEVSKTGEPSGTLVPVTVNSLQKFSNGKTLKDDFGTDYPNDITFPLCEEALEGNNEIPLQVFVPIMDAITPGSGKQNVYLRLDYSTLKKTTDADADFAETEKAPTDPSTIKKQAAQTITVAVKNSKNVVSKKYGDKAFSLGAKAKTGLTYKSSNTKIATVDSKGKVTVKAAGTVKITISAKASTSYKAATKTITLKVAKSNTCSKDKDFIKDTFLQCAEKESTGVHSWHFRDQQGKTDLCKNSRKLCIYRK
ncbi:MAG: NEAT domain-containing protein [Blautia massiliensis (ex Durand et al. 2017)]|uniref:NEAT domain-containing protein n=1 Tax=Blautia massiliensis (ex Durand et al. 2017) TaxID=1737424 RepID=UPI00399CD666